MERITMPQLGETVTEGTIVRWAKAVGEAVDVDDVLFEVSTDKVDTEVPSAHAGVLRAIYVSEGETVPIGALLAVLTATADEPVGEPVDEPSAPPAAGGGLAPADAGFAPPAPGAGPVGADGGMTRPAAGGGAAPARSGGTGDPEDRLGRPVPPGASPSSSEQGSATAGPGVAGEATATPPGGPADHRASDSGGRQGSQGTESGRRDGRAVLSPVVRRLLDEHRLRPEEVVGSGADGRITRADVLAAAANRERLPATAAPPVPAPLPGPVPTTAAAGPVPTTAPAGPVPGPRSGGGPPVPALPYAEPRPGDEVVPMSRARRMTADNLLASIRISVHTLVATQVDYDRLEPVRKAARLSYLPFVARAVVDALAEFPHLNASVGDGELYVHPAVGLGIAVDVGFEALVVPVVHGAADLRLHALARAIADQADKARRKRLTADDLTGGTFTITNVGAYGTTVTSPVITQPQVAILSTDGVRMTPVAVPDGDGGWAVAVHPVGGLSLTFDHRAVDGAYASAFLARVRDTLQQRDWEAER